MERREEGGERESEVCGGEEEGESMLTKTDHREIRIQQRRK